jgi:hypothetical protein
MRIYVRRLLYRIRCLRLKLIRCWSDWNFARLIKGFTIDMKYDIDRHRSRPVHAFHSECVRNARKQTQVKCIEGRVKCVVNSTLCIIYLCTQRNVWNYLWTFITQYEFGNRPNLAVEIRRSKERDKCLWLLISHNSFVPALNILFSDISRRGIVKCFALHDFISLPAAVASLFS